MAVGGADFRIATVGLVGALLGGVLSFGGVTHSEYRRDQREDRRELRDAEGAARVMVDEYRAAGLYLERNAQTGKVWPVPTDVEIKVSADDRKLIASNLSSDAYGRASEAAVNANLSLRALVSLTGREVRTHLSAPTSRTSSTPR